jgi:hypothetical protein
MEGKIGGKAPPSKTKRQVFWARQEGYGEKSHSEVKELALDSNE